jgi:FkbM family methyltransferase
MHILSLIRPKPEYVFRPAQIVRRITREFKPANEYEDVMLPWSLPIRIRPREAIGSVIWRLGVYELSVSEAIYRLVDPGELAIDVGANFGYMTSIMASRVGATGTVLSFEPHPVTFNELSCNVQRWAETNGTGYVRAHRVALSDTSGRGILTVPGDDSVERGRASLADTDSSLGPTYATEVRTIGEFIDDRQQVGVMKVDVEGHEYRVLKGAEGTLYRRGIRDVIFEDYRPYPTETTELLQATGYTVFSVGLKFWGLSVVPGRTGRSTRPDYIPTYLATSDPDRALHRLRKPGWAVLNPPSSSRRLSR